MDNVTQYCKERNIEITDYIVDCLDKQNSIDRYGDLNLIRTDKNEHLLKKEEENTYNIVRNVETVKDYGIPKIEAEAEDTNISEKIEDKPVEVKKKRRRTLKTN